MADRDRVGEAVARIESVLHDVTASGRVRSQLDGTEHPVFPVAIDPDEGRALRRWVERASPAAPVEIGLGFAVSTLYLCAGMLVAGRRGWRHVAVDPNQRSWYHDCGLQLIAEAGLARNVEHVSDESQLALPRFVAEGRAHDFAFVDGNHRFDRVFLDLIYLGRLLAPSSIVFVDDYQFPAIRKACAFCRRNLDWTLEEVSPAHPHHQWAVLRTASRPDTRPFDYFVDF